MGDRIVLNKCDRFLINCYCEKCDRTYEPPQNATWILNLNR
ncbi:hypothetical protein [Synechocystis sp. PCC 7509]|nr:hypothetical protein [Synechocystis sp. PCC 7509]